MSKANIHNNIKNNELDANKSNADGSNASDFDKSWQKLQSDWQSYQPDVKKIKQKISWVTWRMIALLTLDVIALIVYTVFLYLEIYQKNENWLVAIWFYLMGIAVLYGVYIDFKLRIPVFRLQGNSSQDVLNLYLKRTQVGVRLGQICQYVFAALLICFWLWRYLILEYLPEDNIYNRKDITLSVSLWIVFCIVACYWYKNKKAKELQHLRQLWQGFVD
jgi:hypothetical protein